jgi:hypothetical protein
MTGGPQAVALEDLGQKRAGEGAEYSDDCGEHRGFPSGGLPVHKAFNRDGNGNACSP